MLSVATPQKRIKLWSSLTHATVCSLLNVNLGEKKTQTKKEHNFFSVKKLILFPTKMSQSEINLSLIYSVLSSEVFIKASACLNGLHSMSSIDSLLGIRSLTVYYSTILSVENTYLCSGNLSF